LDFNIDFNLVRSQKLLLIPQLKQAIEILEMNSKELFRYIENQLESNPALVKAMDDGMPTDFMSGTGLAESVEEEQELQVADLAGALLSLKEHLLIQLHALCPDRISYIVGEYLIDNTDDNGYLKADTGEVAEYLDLPEESVLRVLKKLQSLEPPGICARNLRECLLLQLRQLEETDDETVLIVERYLNAIANDDTGLVAKETGIPPDRVSRIFKRVRNLEPRPGRQYYRSEAESPEVPDIIIREAGNELQVIFNEEAFPEVCISEHFINSASFMNDSAENGKDIHDRLNHAVWLIKCLEQREDILFTIAQRLCREEEVFFRKGPRALRLLDREAFAGALCMHETILDKALKGKFLQSRWGLYEMRSFFQA